MKEVCLNTSLIPAEPKARSFWFAWTTVKTWHCPHCHLVKTKKIKEVFPVIACMTERPYFSIPYACLHPQYDLTQMKCYPLLWLMLNCKCCIETLMIRNQMTHFCIFQLILIYCLHVLLHVKDTDLCFLSYSSTLFFSSCMIFASGHSLIGKTVVSGKLLSFLTF